MRGKELVALARSRPVLADGAMGTMLLQEGLSAGACPELWNVERPDVVRGIHEAYIRAGSEAISTNTFGCNRIKLGAYGLEERTMELNTAGVRLAKDAANESAFVMGSIGPTGQFLQPLGDVTFEDAVAVFYEQSVAMAEAGVDALLFETFSDLQELKAGLVAGLRTGVPCFCTMAFDVSGRTMMGVDPAQAAIELSKAGALGVGANCGGGPEEMLEVVKRIREATTEIVIAQPNAGVPRLENAGITYQVSPAEMASYARKFADMGVNIIGACCGSTPEHIRAIREALILE